MLARQYPNRKTANSANIPRSVVPKVADFITPMSLSGEKVGPVLIVRRDAKNAYGKRAPNT
jgi:hypothetical protein